MSDGIQHIFLLAPGFQQMCWRGRHSLQVGQEQGHIIVELNKRLFD